MSGEKDEKEFFDNEELDDIFAVFDEEGEIDLGETLYNCIEPFFKHPRKMLAGSKALKISLPEKKRIGAPVYHNFLLSYDKIKAYEVLPVTVNRDRSSYPLNFNRAADYTLGEVFLFGFSKDETEWYAMDLFIPVDDIQKIENILLEKTSRPQLKGLTHYGNLAAVKYIMSLCEKIYEYQVDVADWIKSSSFVRPIRDKFEKYAPREGENKPPKIYVFKEGIAQVFSDDSSSILHQMSTFWPWYLISNVIEKENKLIFEWYDKTYSFTQLISKNADRLELKKVCLECLTASRSIQIHKTFFIRSNSFPSRYEASWYNLEPFACEASRVGLPPTIR
ncbi:MAG: hypothetical protein OdinLCB4_001340 [Candidatus Odinarchaeum yellowstonii]|uniref:Uncharacterized protein n=1 Tax=Odinarchaeota yellowstonii (strain LCB_4) TaxID=1841599 RepID=A0AAF0D2R3_ODILC|nr:MAG: hypothetical protein OdinLCB4_001340 [Candidatus Odinarchaeum yellowstonii]